MGKFTLSDGIATATTGISLLGSVGKGLKFDPRGDKPKKYIPKVSPVVGDPNFQAYLNELNKDFSTTSNMVREYAGSDSGMAMKGIFEADQQRQAGKGKVFAQHSQMVKEDQRFADQQVNEAERYNVDAENAWRARMTERDAQGAYRAQDAAREAIASGAQYFADRDAYNQAALSQEKSYNDYIEMTYDKYFMDMEAQLSQLYSPEQAAAYVNARRAELRPKIDGYKRYNYGKRPTAETPPVASATATAAGDQRGISQPLFYTGAQGQPNPGPTTPPMTEEEIMAGIRKFFSRPFKSGIPDGN